MNVGATRPQQALISSVSDQGVFEDVARVRRHTATKDQLDLHQGVQCRVQFGLGQRGQHGDGVVIEASADHSGGLGNFLDRSEAIES
jgi:hypothetical protein